MCVCISLCGCMCVNAGACRGQKGASDPPEGRALSSYALPDMGSGEQTLLI